MKLNKEAIKIGFYESPHYKKIAYPKIQMLTIEGLLMGSVTAICPS